MDDRDIDVVEVTVDGRPIRAQAGQSLGAALVTNGITAWRATRVGGRPRGLFCGIGVCFDCLITVDGERGQRACCVQVADGMRVETGLEP
ncbi:(2Fe-2S)-binding protein [Saccharomonospora xinjiangensis]|uniref:(2Fe-2S)-binding protein n=1 Tax=Saccharomonospora xinjiangensis TaxID=75294 RepID=UPI0035106093